MFMKINEEIAVNEGEKGFRVTLFDNRKGGKDHGVKLATDLRQTFTRVLRSGYVNTNHGTQQGVNADVEYCQFHEVPFTTTGFKIDEVKIHMANNSEGKQDMSRRLSVRSVLSMLSCAKPSKPMTR